MLFLKSRSLFVVPCIALLFLILCGTAKKENAEENSETSSGPIRTLHSPTQLDTIIEKAGGSLLAFDLYADWCRPCRILSPTLEKIAAGNLSKVTFYRINIDKFPQVARDFGVNGIPLVVFMKNKTVVKQFVGVQPEEDYIRTIIENAAN
jgi:Thioredoxin domain-containing protein